MEYNSFWPAHSQEVCSGTASSHAIRKPKMTWKGLSGEKLRPLANIQHHLSDLSQGFIWGGPVSQELEQEIALESPPHWDLI